MATTQIPTPIKVYAANWKYQALLGALTAICVLGSAYVSMHNQKVSVLMWLITGLYLLAFATVVSLKVGFNSEGLTQRWLFSRLLVKWNEVARLEKTARSFSLRDAKGTSLILLFLLTPAAQQSLAEETITRARLRPGKAPAKPPVLEYWEKKK